MSQKRKNFIVRNDPFTCLRCGFENEALTPGCRNHCSKCLYSQHVDEDVPGDRLSKCMALMKPIAVDDHSKKGKMIVHQCVKCGKRMRNMLAKDDNIDAIINVLKDNGKVQSSKLKK